MSVSIVLTRRLLARIGTKHLLLGGLLAVQQLKQVATTLKMFPVFESVNIPFHAQFIDEEGQVQARRSWSRRPAPCSTS